jgi:hypothetical protein
MLKTFNGAVHFMPEFKTTLHFVTLKVGKNPVYHSDYNNYNVEDKTLN